jgi:LCCL domain
LSQRRFLVSLLGLLALGPGLASAQQYVLVANEYSHARAFQDQPGRYLTFICPADVPLNGEIWGTDVYTDTSPICTAAAHAGRFTPRSTGVVTIVLRGPADSFQPSTRNGVTSLAYGYWAGSYAFADAGEPGQVDWQTTAQHIPADFTAPLVLLCPAGGDTTAPIWGTDTYTDTSAICVAAVHAGIISAAAGGRIRFTVVPPVETYAGSIRNGVASLEWRIRELRERPNPFKVSPAALNIRTPVAGGELPGQGRTIPLAGFAAAGTAAPVVHRTVELAGFSASGMFRPVTPRTVTSKGWTAVGEAPTP